MDLEIDEFDGEPVYRVELVPILFNRIDIVTSTNGEHVSMMPFDRYLNEEAYSLNLFIKRNKKNLYITQNDIDKVKIVNSTIPDKWFVTDCIIKYFIEYYTSYMIENLSPCVVEFKNKIYPPKKYHVYRQDNVYLPTNHKYEYSRFSLKDNKRIISQQYGSLCLGNCFSMTIGFSYRI